MKEVLDKDYISVVVRADDLVYLEQLAAKNYSLILERASGTEKLADTIYQSLFLKSLIEKTLQEINEVQSSEPSFAVTELNKAELALLNTARKLGASLLKTTQQ